MHNLLLLLWEVHVTRTLSKSVTTCDVGGGPWILWPWWHHQFCYQCQKPSPVIVHLKLFLAFE